MAYDGAADTVALSVPARCIGSPRWARLGIKVTASPEADPEAQTMTIYFADDGHRGGLRENSIGKVRGSVAADSPDSPLQQHHDLVVGRVREHVEHPRLDRPQ